MCTMNNITTKLSDSDFNDVVTKLNAPFELYQFDCSRIIQNSDAFKLRTALLTMTFAKKTCDLYSFDQTSDLNSIPNSSKPKEVKQFMDVLKEIKKKVAAYLRIHFNNTISVCCSKYDTGDYLLCHDDRVDDRSVAFVYYLNYDWLNEWGGTLDIYSVDENNDAEKIVKNINPQFNTMLFFPVGKHTYHQVAENLSNFSRISINGWFHSDTLSWKTYDQLLDRTVTPIYLPVHISDARINIIIFCIEDMYNDFLYRETIKEIFIGEGYILLHGFFKPKMVEMLTNELFSNDLQWKVKGPLNIKCHKYLNLMNLQFTNILFVVNMLKTDYMFNFLTECTGLEFYGVNIEVQRWHGGHYMVSGGNNTVDHLNTLSVYFFFNKCLGEMSDNDEEDLHYVFADRHTALKKFACVPQDNTMFIVIRDSNLESYVKYCKKVKGHAWTVITANYFIKKNLNCKVLVDKIFT